jgi:membrane fusion protein (multidrug efflux system)
VEIRTHIDGYIEQKRFNGGQSVKARSHLAQSRVALLKAEWDVARYEPLVKAEAATQQDLDAAVAQRDVVREEVAARQTDLEQTRLTLRPRVAQATAELEAAWAGLRLAEINLGYTEIRAPVTGRIGESEAFVGSLATKTSPKLLTLLSPLDPIQVKLRVGERDYLQYVKSAGVYAAQAKTSAGARLDFQLVLADGTVSPHPGRLRAADRAVDPQTGTLEITLDFPNPGALFQTAFWEVSDALIGYHKTREQRRQQALLVAALQDRVALASQHFLGGLDSYPQVLDAERALFEAELTLVRLQRDELLTTVQLYRALSGGWEAAEPYPAPL